MDGRSETRDWNATRTDYPRDRALSALFEEIAAQAPASVALTTAGRDVSYAELNETANRVAWRLIGLGVRRGSLVGLCMERSCDMIAGMLGILKAGGAYVPLDPDYPADRLAFMLRDSRVPVTLVHAPTADRLLPLTGKEGLLSLDAGNADPRRGQATNPEVGVTADDPAYVMYTSGSTGSPKGVTIGHRAVVRLVKGTNYCTFGRDEVFLQLAPVSFDASTFEIWGPLLNGARLALMPPRPPALHEIGGAIKGYGVTTLWLTAGLFHLMVDQRPGDLSTLRQLLAGGDVLSPSHVQRALDAMHDGVVVNGYGPTESTTFACCFRMVKGYRAGATVPIGRPVSNTTVYLLDENLRPVPEGEPGELCVGGDGLAAGYLNAPELTRDKFVPDPFDGDPDARLYRTGDRARRRPDGDLEFLGRIDDQVKILGHRVEPGEVEAVLRSHPEVRQALVAASADDRGETRLVGYVIGNDPDAPSAAVLKEHLGIRLPPYMIPSIFVHVEAFPLSPNGKVDRSAIPAPERRPSKVGGASGSPDDLERAICEAWERALKCRVGLDDNFFDLGGNSLRLIEVHSDLQDRVRRDVSVIDLFEYTTVRALAHRLRGGASSGAAFTGVDDRAKKQAEAYSRRKTSKATQVNE